MYIRVYHRPYSVSLVRSSINLSSLLAHLRALRVLNLRFSSYTRMKGEKDLRRMDGGFEGNGSCDMSSLEVGQMDDLNARCTLTLTRYFGPSSS